MASSESGNAPSWLFSFVDLAFLSLIAMTQLMSDIDTNAPDLGEMVVPRLEEEASSPISSGASDLWQLRVYPTDEETTNPFALVPAGLPEEPSEESRIDAEQLRVQLAEFESDGRAKPLLAPHRDSRSQNLLDAAALIEEFWPARRRVLISFDTTSNRT